MDVYFTINQLKSPVNTTHPDEEVIYQSEVFPGFHSNALPISREVENMPLGGNGYRGFDNPRIKFYNRDTGEIIAQFGHRLTGLVNAKYDPISQQGEHIHGSVNTDGAILKVLFTSAFP